MGCNSCGSNRCTCCPSTCPEVCAAVFIKNSWTIPACNQQAVLHVPYLKSILVGSYIWNPNYGFFLVTAFNNLTSQVTIKNECLVGNAVAGTSVAACTVFMNSAPPMTAPGTGSVTSIFPYLYLDFVAPANGVCVTITVTTTNGLFVGQGVAISDGIYRISAIPTSSTITICNDGDGITPGETVSARTSTGLLQYPITQAFDCCADLTAEIAVLDGRIDDLDDSINTEIPWVVTITADAPMTVGATTPVYAGYFRVGHLIYYSWQVLVTVGGTPSTTLFWNVPVQANDLNHTGSGRVLDVVGGTTIGCTTYLQTTSLGGIFKSNGANYPGNQIRLSGSGWYVAA